MTNFTYDDDNISKCIFRENMSSYVFVCEKTLNVHIYFIVYENMYGPD